MHSKGKGLSSSALPYKRTAPSWLKITEVEVRFSQLSACKAEEEYSAANLVEPATLAMSKALVGHVQRYCRRCKVWFDWDCLEHQAGTQAAVPIPFANGDQLLSRVARMPILRGRIYDQDVKEPWCIVGSGLAVKTANSYIKAGTQPNGWKKELGEELVEFVSQIGTTLKVLPCPTCGENI